MRYVLISSLGLAGLVLTGCSMTSGGPACLDCGAMVAGGPPMEGEVPQARPGTVLPGAGAVTASGLPPLDGTPVAPKIEATTAAAVGVAVAPVAGSLGTVVASLGDPGRPGLWLETTLVTKKQKGRVTLASGQSVEVDLLPVTTADGRLSVAAYKALGLGITELPTVTVSAL